MFIKTYLAFLRLFLSWEGKKKERGEEKNGKEVKKEGKEIDAWCVYCDCVCDFPLDSDLNLT